MLDLPKSQETISYKWIFKRKVEITKDGAEVIRYKARLVAKGFTQREWIDFNEVFSPVVKLLLYQNLNGIVA